MCRSTGDGLPEFTRSLPKEETGSLFPCLVTIHEVLVAIRERWATIREVAIRELWVTIRWVTIRRVTILWVTIRGHCVAGGRQLPDRVSISPRIVAF